MAAALFRRGTGLCCIHRELCRLVWRPQTAHFSSKPFDRKQPRRTHIKKAKPQPAVDIAKLLEQLFSQQRPGKAPPAARPAKSSSVPTKTPTASSIKTSTSNAPLSSKTEPAAFPAASSINQVESVPEKTTSAFNASPLSPQPQPASPTNPKTSSETPQQTPLDFIQASAADSVSSVTSTTPASLGSEAVEIIETSVETATAPPLSASVDGPVEPTVDVEVETKDSGVVDVSQSAKEEPLIETTIESPVEASHFPVETLETRAAAVEGPVEAAIDVTVGVAAESNSTNSGNISPTAKVEPTLETTVGPSVETSPSPLKTVECPVEPTVDAPAQAVQTDSTDSGPVNLPHTAAVEPLIETIIDPSLEASTSPLETPESRPAVAEGSAETKIETEADTAAQVGQINKPDSGVINISYSAEAGPLIETTKEQEVEASSLEVNKPEQMTLESVTLHGVEVQVESLKTDELLQTTSALDEKAEKRLRELLVEAEAGPELKAETENSSEGEREILTEVLSKWDSLSEDLQELEGESSTLVNELLCHVPGTVKTSSASNHNATGKPLQMEAKGTESMTLESITLANVTAEVGGFDAEVLLETRNALESEAEVRAKEEKTEVTTTMEDVAVFENTIEEELLALDSISEATDAIEAETSVMLEVMFGSEQGPRQPSDPLLLNQKLGQQEAEKLSEEQEGSVLEAMTLESVTLAEVEASLGTLENESLSETSDYLEKEAEVRAKKEKIEVTTSVEDVSVFVDTTEAEILALDSLSEVTDAIEAETSVVLEAMFGSEQGPRQPSDQKLGQHGEEFSQEAQKLSEDQEGSVLEAMTLESVTLAEVEASLGSLENKSLSETSDYLEKEAELRAKKEKMEVTTAVEDVSVFVDTTEAELLALDSLSEVTDAIEAETSVMLEVMFGSEQGPRQPSDPLLLNEKLEQHEEGKESGEQEGSVLEAMTLESVTLAEVEASLGTLENESLSETSDYLEKEAEVLAGEKRVEVEDGVASEEMTEPLKIESLSLPEADAPSEAQTDALMEELLFSVPGPAKGVKGGSTGQEATRANILDAAVVTGSVDAETAAAVTDDCPASPALTEELLGQEVEEERAETEALGNEDGEGTHAGLDPVQRLFLEKIREYDNMHRLSGGPLEAEPDYMKYLSEETAKLQRLYGGGDLSSFPEFTFTEPEMDQDSK